MKLWSSLQESFTTETEGDGSLKKKTIPNNRLEEAELIINLSGRSRFKSYPVYSTSTVKVRDGPSNHGDNLYGPCKQNKDVAVDISRTIFNKKATATDTASELEVLTIERKTVRLSFGH